jgi:hypothetical protein
MSATLSTVRRSIFPAADDTWASIAARELKGTPETEAISLLQSWNMHVFMRAAAPAGSPRAGRQVLPSDVIFVEAPKN